MKREKTIIRTSIIGITTNIILVLVKAATGIFAHSLAIILEAINNLTDVISSVLTIIGTKLAGREPDREHPYGHGRIEYITTMFVGIIILSSGLIALIEAIKKIIIPQAVNYGTPSLIIMAAAVLTKFFLGVHYQRVGKKVNSDTLVASGIDALSDAFLSIATVIGIIINLLSGFNPEGILSSIIAIFIIKSGIQILLESWRDLIGRRTDSTLSVSIKKHILKFNEVSGVYDLFLHNYGPTKVVGAVHIQVPDSMKATDIDALSRKITKSVFEEFHVLLTIGIYAQNSNTKERRDILKQVNAILADFPDAKHLHGFWVDDLAKHITFDLVFDYDHPRKLFIKNKVAKHIRKLYPDYSVNITIDTDISD